MSPYTTPSVAMTRGHDRAPCSACLEDILILSTGALPVSMRAAGGPRLAHGRLLKKTWATAGDTSKVAVRQQHSPMVTAMPIDAIPR